MRFPRLPLRPSPLTVWSVEPDQIQLTWGHLPAGPIRASTAGAAPVELDHPGGPGHVVLADLQADRAHRIRIDIGNDHQELTARTLPAPPGEELARFATISDLHLGSDHFGFFKQMRDHDHDGREPFAYRSADGAIRAARAWGATHLVIKGDAAHHGRHHDFAEVGRLVDAHPDLPMTLLPGNHDVDEKHGVSLPETVGRRRLAYERGTRAIDLDGLRLVVGDTTIARKGTGTLADIGDALLDHAADGDQPVMIAIHQQLQEHHTPRYWPPGISGREGRQFLDALGLARPSSLVTSGHTHRNRRRHHGPTVVTEVASTHHWPGVWAGYRVYEGGITQSVRRIADPSIVDWHEYTRAAVLSVWGRYAPGRLDDRSFAHRWS